VGELIRIASARGRSVRPDLELGVCGEHGGDPASIGFFHKAGVVRPAPAHIIHLTQPYPAHIYMHPLCPVRAHLNT
jgi:hypothetical protein